MRNLPTFPEFLDVAALSDGEIVNFSNVARESGVSSHTARSYFEILEDTLLARWLPAYRKRSKRRVIAAPKLYFADVGVVDRPARRGTVEPGSEAFGKAFENWVFHQLSAFVRYREFDGEIAYWRLASGIQVDFVLGDMAVAVEARSSARISADHLKGLRTFVDDHPGVQRRIVVCREPKARHTDDGIDMVPFAEFVRRLWQDELI